MKYKTIYGIEIETTFNNEVITINKSSYHSSNLTKFGKDFYCESDASLHTNIDYPGSVEIISRPFEYKELKKILESFKAETERRTRAKKFKQVFNVNSSCGCHIHFSVLLENKKADKTVIQFKDYKKVYKGYKYLKLKPLFNDQFKKLIRSNVFYRVKKLMPKSYSKSYHEKYFRSYAAKVDKVENCIRDRRREFNLTNNDNTIEFRSFNIQGVKTWDEFYKMINIGIESIERAVKNELSKKEMFIKIEKEDLKQVFDSKRLPKTSVSNKIVRRVE